MDTNIYHDCYEHAFKAEMQYTRKGINADTENMINKCPICQENLRVQPKEILQVRDIPR